MTHERGYPVRARAIARRAEAKPLIWQVAAWLTGLAATAWLGLHI